MYYTPFQSLIRTMQFHWAFSKIETHSSFPLPFVSKVGIPWPLQGIQSSITIGTHFPCNTNYI
jgi:hypothetical protein